LRKVGLNVVQDGVFGQQTKGAVVAFQAQEGLPKVGYVGPQTRAALIRVANSSEPARSFRGCPQLKDGVFSKCVKRLISEFNAIPGHDDLATTMLYDGTIADAVRAYQSSNGLVVDGVVGRQTADLIDVQAGPSEVCYAISEKIADKNGNCVEDGAIGDGKSVWSCVKDIFGIDTVREMAMDHTIEFNGIKSKSRFVRVMGKFTGVPAQAAACVMFG
jgi:peptidoglycan hydrolase-like protein with peptidoglycan-binding domain